MSKPELQDQDEAGEIQYQGNRVPAILNWIYVVFVIWALAYFVHFLFPDLLSHLN